MSGHFSITDPREEDNLASLEISIMPQVGFLNPYWYVGSFQWSTKGEVSDIPKWALTVEYEKISERCFPKLKLELLKSNA